MFDKYSLAIEKTDPIKYQGSVTRVQGLLIESNGPQVVMGELCQILIPKSGQAIWAEVVGIHSVREAAGHRVVAEWLHDLPEDEQGCLTVVNRYLEGVISAHKGQYFWLHPRWKKRPPGEPSLYPGLKF